ncbi:discoidin domain-containing protein [Marinicellulosiphila megalodicopiae]|uniref:discoidin domain-containing protein n=1 Tax=Marinicellulosiphila megalodicopiae TaxID=2724896 RepID=UPI003BAF6679
MINTLSLPIKIIIPLLILSLAACQPSTVIDADPIEDGKTQSTTDISTGTPTDTSAQTSTQTSIVTNTDSNTETQTDATPSPSSDSVVTIYSECDYKGERVELALGKLSTSDLTANAIGNDAISSISIPSGYIVTLFDNDLEGDAIVNTQSSNCLDNENFNNQTSSVSVDINPDSVSLLQGQSDYAACTLCHGDEGDGLYKIEVNACVKTDCTDLTVLALYIESDMSSNTTNGCGLDVENIASSCAATTAAYIQNHFSTDRSNTTPNPETNTETDSNTQTDTVIETELETDTQTETTGDPIEVSPIDHSAWLLDASSNTADLALLIDGDISSRWTSKQYQTPGQWISIDLQDVYVVSTIELDMGTSVDDFPQSYEVYVSYDGANWGTAIATGVGSAVTVIEFDQVNTQYIKIVQTGTSSTKWLSIHEINISGANALDSTDTQTDTTVDPEPYVCPDIQALMLQSDLNCTNAACHASSPSQSAQISLTGTVDSIALRLADADSISKACSDLGEKVIDSQNPENSLLLKLVDPNSGDQCSRKMPVGSDHGVTEDQFACFVNWVDEIAAAAPTIVEPEPIFEAVPALSALTKVKELLHGGALTIEEVDSIYISDTQINQDQLKAAIEDWMTTPAYEQKFKAFLQLALQQKNVNTDMVYANQFDTIVTAAKNNGYISNTKMKANFEESFVRTAYKIVSQGGDFRQIANTRDWEVTTALLWALSYGDEQAKNPGGTRFRAFVHLCGDLYTDEDVDCGETDDYADWRTVTLTQGTAKADIEQSAALAQSLREVPAGGSFALLAPRVGFFTTPVFFQSWESNVGNQFRVTANQAMIVGLGLSYESGDVTPSGDLSGLDVAHAGEDNPECYACHRMMDPMTQIFKNHYHVFRSRAIPTAGNTPASFAFHGYEADLDTIDDLGQAIFDHPHFSTGWTAKLCNWASSKICDESGSEFKRLVGVFEQSDYNLTTLVIEMMSSPLITGIDYVDDFATTQPSIVLNRTNHFCTTLETRLNQVRASQGLPDSTYANICNSTADSIAASSLLPEDGYTRGTIEFVQSVSFDPFLSAGYNQLCESMEVYMVRAGAGSGGDAKYNAVFNSNQVDQSINELITYIMAIPQASNDYEPTYTALRRMYDIHNHQTSCLDAGLDPVTANQGLSGDDLQCGFAAASTAEAFRPLWNFACSSPSLLGLGL